MVKNDDLKANQKMFSAFHQNFTSKSIFSVVHPISNEEYDELFLIYDSTRLKNICNNWCTEKMQKLKYTDLETNKSGIGCWNDLVQAYNRECEGNIKPTGLNFAALYPNNFAALYPNNFAALYPNNFAALYPNNFAALYPNNFAALYPNNFAALYPNNFAALYPNNFAALYPNNFAALYPNNFAALYPNNFAALYPNNFAALYPNNFAALIPDNFAALIPDNFEKQKVSLALNVFNEKTVIALRLEGKELEVRMWKMLNVKSKTVSKRLNDPDRICLL